MITLKKNKHYSQRSLKDHIDHVVENYHERFKQDSQVLLKKFEKTCLALSCPYLHHAKDLFNYLSQKITFHLVMEENVVFPMMLNNTTGDRLNLIIQTMEAEHAEDNSIVSDIIKALGQADQNDKISNLLNDLEKFQDHLKEHTHYEDEYVFKSQLPHTPQQPPAS